MEEAQQQGETMYLNTRHVVLAGVFVFLALIMTATAEDISGTWIARTSILTVTMVFKVDGTSLTGTVRTRPADETEIKDGKINGDKVSFYIVRKENNKNVKVRFEGIVNGDEIEFTRDANGSVTKVTARRSHPNSSIVM
jgi:hypothetical protein